MCIPLVYAEKVSMVVGFVQWSWIHKMNRCDACIILVKLLGKSVAFIRYDIYVYIYIYQNHIYLYIYMSIYIYIIDTYICMYMRHTLGCKLVLLRMQCCTQNVIPGRLAKT